MSTQRLIIGWLACGSLLVSPQQVAACWLTDYFYGRSPSSIANYPVVPGQTVVVGQPALSSQPFVAGRPVVVNQPAVPQYSVQRPAYVDNPSVYTGMPVNTGAPNNSINTVNAIGTGVPAPFTSARPAFTSAPSALPLVPRNQVPLSSAYRGLATPGNSFFGTGNRYPTNFEVPGNQFPSYSSAYPSTAAAGTIPVPATSMPAAPIASPFAATPVAPAPGGLRGWLGSMFGTDYRSSYFRAPITYYRPLTTVDPLNGVPITTQQACSSSVELLQRTPVQTLQPASSFPVAPPPTLPAGPCAPAGDPCGAPLMGAPSLPSASSSGAPNTFAPPTNYSVPPAGAAPLAPPPSSAAPFGASPLGSPSDRAPVPQPQLQQSQRVDPQPSRQIVAPIPAPADYRSPYQQNSAATGSVSPPPFLSQPASPSSSGGGPASTGAAGLTAPRLAPRSWEPLPASNNESRSNVGTQRADSPRPRFRSSLPAREASLRTSAVTAPRRPAKSPAVSPAARTTVESGWYAPDR